MMKLSPEWRYAVYYAALFSSIGSIGPFFAVWLDSLGIDARMIGIIAASPSIVMIFTTVFIGRWADSLSDRRTAIIVCNLLVLLVQVIFFWDVNPWVILVVWTFAGILIHAKVPITDAAALSVTRQRNTDFARVRVYGSIGFAAALALSGYVYDVVGMVAFVPILFLGNLLRLWLSTKLPKNEIATNENSCSKAPESSGGLYQPGVLLTIVGSSFIQASHAVVYTFGILLWTQQGVSETTGSLLIAIGVVAEVILMWKFKSVARYFSARGCLVVAAACGLARWIVLAFSPPLAVTFLAQALHSITFGLTFLATATFISRRVGEADAARGQSLSATVITALMAAAMYVSGYYFDALGMSLYWIMAGMCAVAMLLVLLSYKTNLVDIEQKATTAG